MRTLTDCVAVVLARGGMTPQQIKHIFAAAKYMQEKHNAEFADVSEHLAAKQDGVRRGKAEWMAERGRQTNVVSVVSTLPVVRSK